MDEQQQIVLFSLASLLAQCLHYCPECLEEHINRRGAQRRIEEAVELLARGSPKTPLQIWDEIHYWDVADNDEEEERD